MVNYQKDGDTIQQKQHFSLNRDDEKHNSLLSRGCEASDMLKKHIENDNIIRLISHNDADGLSSAGVIANAIKEEGGQFHITIVPRLKPDVIRDVAKEKYEQEHRQFS